MKIRISMRHGRIYFDRPLVNGSELKVKYGYLVPRFVSGEGMIESESEEIFEGNGIETSFILRHPIDDYIEIETR